MYTPGLCMFYIGAIMSKTVSENFFFPSSDQEKNNAFKKCCEHKMC